MKIVKKILRWLEVVFLFIAFNMYLITILMIVGMFNTMRMNGFDVPVMDWVYSWLYIVIGFILFVRYGMFTIGKLMEGVKVDETK
jgi:hypothetical protein